MTLAPIDPYRQFSYRVRWDGRQVAGISRMSGLAGATELRGGVVPPPASKPIGAFVDDSIVLERGVTFDLAFDRWVRDAAEDAPAELLVDHHDETGRLVVTYKILHCRAMEYVRLLPDGTDAIQFQAIRLHHRGWERIPVDPDPIEPSVSEPSP